VYLSSESDETLSELRPDEVYIVGGLVDRNRHKGLTQRLAAEAGVRTARLPLGSLLDPTKSRVLATNHVVDLLARVWGGASWAEALERVLPPRKTTEGAAEAATPC
jgi:tRNA (guanine9-N1)-methyltransferase